MSVTSYLAIKNWRTYQHYSDRRPPWIKLMRELIDGDNGRAFRDDLTEPEQWQLVRLWLYASGSDIVMHDMDGREVPLIVNDEAKLRLGIRSLKKVAVEKFVRLGFLTVIPASAVASTDASAGASTTASTAPSKNGRGNTPPPARTRTRAPAPARRAEVPSEELTPRAVPAPRPDEPEPPLDDLPEDAGPPSDEQPWIEDITPTLLKDMR